MEHSEVKKILTTVGAIEENGHFILSSGKRSPTYIQCSKLFAQPSLAVRLCEALAAKLSHLEFSVTAAPAIGAIIIGYEIARIMNKKSIFCEREPGKDGFQLRRGFSDLIGPGDKVLLVEDVVTTGKSSLEAINCVQSRGAEVIAVACLVKRSDAQMLNVPIISLISVEVPTYDPDKLPPEIAKLPPVKPGSRSS